MNKIPNLTVLKKISTIIIMCFITFFLITAKFNSSYVDISNHDHDQKSNDYRTIHDTDSSTHPSSHSHAHTHKHSEDDKEHTHYHFHSIAINEIIIPSSFLIRSSFQLVNEVRLPVIKIEKYDAFLLNIFKPPIA